MTRRTILYIFSNILLCLFACHGTPYNEVVEDVVFKLESFENGEVESTEYTDLTFIPLDNARECQLSHVSRLKVTDAGYYILNDAEHPSVFLFNVDGTYNHKVGGVGRSKSEYLNIMDIAANTSGDTIAILTLSDLKYFDADGKFIASYPIRDKQRWENVLHAPEGFVCSRNYRGTDCLVALFDNKFSSPRKIVATDETIVTGEPPYADNILQSDGKYLCYMDMFNSRFYVLEWGDMSHIRCYVLNSDRIMTLSNVQEEGRDYIYSYVLANHMIKGEMLYKDDSRGFEIDLENSTFRFCDDKGLFVSFMDYKDGYYYSIVAPMDLLHFMDDKITFLTDFTPSIDSLRSAFAPYKKNLSDKNNYYLLKMKIKSN